MKIYKAVQATLGQGFDCFPSMKKFYADYGMTNHGGYDYPCKTGMPIYWDCDIEGTVLSNERDNMGGLGVSILTDDGEMVLKHRFWHLEGFCCAKGDKVQMGDVIGWADNTGASTGPHLHRDAKELIADIDGQYLYEGRKYSQKYPNNGTFGTIRLDEYMTHKFVCDVLPKETFIRKMLIMISKFLTKGRQ
jgi:hypothetical protein